MHWWIYSLLLTTKMSNNLCQMPSAILDITPALSPQPPFSLFTADVSFTPPPPPQPVCWSFSGWWCESWWALWNFHFSSKTLNPSPTVMPYEHTILHHHIPNQALCLGPPVLHVLDVSQPQSSHQAWWQAIFWIRYAGAGKHLKHAGHHQVVNWETLDQRRMILKIFVI